MNRTDRLFGIALQLQSASVVRARDLAAAFEVSERTIYRDMQALSELGVPIVATPGEGYSLAEGYYLPPLIFTTDEAAALFLSAQLLSSQATGKLQHDVSEATKKIRLRACLIREVSLWHRRAVLNAGSNRIKKLR
jgi:predicted DNA-binding transcriptional regulator YafY